MARSPQFVVDDRGKRTKVLLDIVDYEKILEELEELEDIRLYDEAKASGEEAIPFRPRRRHPKRRAK